MLLGIPGELYAPIYIIVLGIITFVVANKYGRFGGDRFLSNEAENQTPSLILALAVTVFIGFRPVASCFMDMWGYAMGIENHWFDDMDVSLNFLFDRLRRYASRQSWDKYSFLVLIAAIYFIGIWFASRKIFKKDTMLAFVMYLAAFSTFSYGTNGIKAGAAMSFFLVALAFHDQGKKWLSLLFLFVSLGFHHSMQLPLAAFAVCCFVKKPKWFFYLWVVCFFISLFHITWFQTFFASITDAQGAGYLEEESGLQWGKRGFRIDFILYSAVPIVVGWIIVIKRKIHDKKYEFLLNLYTLINAIWLLCMYGGSTNRIAYLSWGIYPIVLLYPFVRFEWLPNQYAVTKKVVIYHWLFTFCMQFIYYGLLDLR